MASIMPHSDQPNHQHITDIAQSQNKPFNNTILKRKTLLNQVMKNLRQRIQYCDWHIYHSCRCHQIFVETEHSRHVSQG